MMLQTSFKAVAPTGTITRRSLPAVGARVQRARRVVAAAVRGGVSRPLTAAPTHRWHLCGSAKRPNAGFNSTCNDVSPPVGMGVGSDGATRRRARAMHHPTRWHHSMSARRAMAMATVQKTRRLRRKSKNSWLPCKRCNLTGWRFEGRGSCEAPPAASRRRRRLNGWQWARRWREQRQAPAALTASAASAVRCGAVRVSAERPAFLPAHG